MEKRKWFCAQTEICKSSLSGAECSFRDGQTTSTPVYTALPCPVQHADDCSIALRTFLFVGFNSSSCLSPSPVWCSAHPRSVAWACAMPQPRLKLPTLFLHPQQRPRTPSDLPHQAPRKVFRKLHLLPARILAKPVRLPATP